jgi:hypothetical protein
LEAIIKPNNPIIDILYRKTVAEQFNVFLDTIEKYGCHPVVLPYFKYFQERTQGVIKTTEGDIRI